MLSGPDPIDLEVGINIRRARTVRGLTQGRLGDALGVSFQQVQKYERGDNRVSASILVKTAKALGMSVLDLLPPETHKTRSAEMQDSLAPIPGADQLIEAYGLIEDPMIRRAGLGVIVALARAGTTQAPDAVRATKERERAARGASNRPPQTDTDDGRKPWRRKHLKSSTLRAFRA